MEKYLETSFVSSAWLTPEFAQFAKDFKKHIKSILPVGAELVNFNRGHFYVSGFVKLNDKYVYFSSDDVRGSQSWFHQLLIRTAKHEEDYTGGSNMFTSLDNFAENIAKLV